MIAGLMVATLSASPATAVGTYSNASIADIALSYVGKWGGEACRTAGLLDNNNTGRTVGGYGAGQCKTFVNCVVKLASGGTQYPAGGDYFQGFLKAGGQEITNVDNLAKGDIVQIGQGVHTTIIVSRVGGSTFNVVDSNYGYDEMVRAHTYTIVLSSTQRAFRMGSVSGGGGAVDLWFAKTRNTGSGRVEVHNETASSSYQNASMHAATWFSTGDQSNGYFQMVGNDLWFIKTRNTGSGRIEVHCASASSGYQQSCGSWASWLGTGDQNNGWFQMEDVDGDGRPDLVFIKTHNTRPVSCRGPHGNWRKRISGGEYARRHRPVRS